jgi:signal transduction histidine kinase
MIRKTFSNNLFPWFAIGIIVPSLLLMVFGLRAIRNERYTLEHRIQQQYYMAATALSEKIEKRVNEMIQYSDSMVVNRTYREISHPLVETSYFLPGKGRIQHYSRYMRRSEVPLESYLSIDRSLDSFILAIKGLSGEAALSEAKNFAHSETDMRYRPVNTRAVSAYISLFSAAKANSDSKLAVNALKALLSETMAETASVMYEEAVFYSNYALGELKKYGESPSVLAELSAIASKRRKIAAEIYKLEEVSVRGKLPESGFHYLDTSLYFIKPLETYGSLVLKLSPEAILEAAKTIIGSVNDAEVSINGPDGSLFAGNLNEISASGSGQVGIRTRFAPSLPMLTLQIVESKPDEIRGLLNRYRLFYGIFFFLLVVSIGVGSFSLILAARRETEIARMRAHFIAGVSHELKTPLTSIHMLAEMLQSGKVKDESKKNEYYVVINRESERLGGLINRVLDFSKINEGTAKIERKPVEIEVVIDEALMSLSALLDDKDVEVDRFRSRESLIINGDRKMLLQVVLNLVENAVKYSVGKPHIVISTHIEGDMISFSVRDHGIGVTPGEEKMIFGEFFRGSSEMVRSVAGTGLGLAIVSRIVKQHGGKISARNADCGGFIIETLFPKG